MQKLAYYNHSVLTWYHPRFGEFTALFGDIISPDGNGWDRSTPSHSVTRTILHTMGGIDVEKSVNWMKEHGACFDDVEVGVNIIGGYWERVDRGEIAPWDGQLRT